MSMEEELYNDVDIEDEFDAECLASNKLDDKISYKKGWVKRRMNSANPQHRADIRGMTVEQLLIEGMKARQWVEIEEFSTAVDGSDTIHTKEECQHPKAEWCVYHVRQHGPGWTNAAKEPTREKILRMKLPDGTTLKEDERIAAPKREKHAAAQRRYQAKLDACASEKQSE